MFGIMVGTSSKSWEAAAPAAVERASQSLRDLRVAEVTEQDVQIKDGKIELYRTMLKLSFKFEEFNLVLQVAVGSDHVGAARASRAVSGGPALLTRPDFVRLVESVHKHTLRIAGIWSIYGGGSTRCFARSARSCLKASACAR